ncbi:hypothetical protein [Lysinibacillus fusiformis]|uniref:hypothetical protein n=1 Tax=Lysinibacillus fusiformis TaxID=28031 RepID=UPI003D09334A
MRALIDPSLHIVDTVDSFILVTKNINLKLEIKEPKYREKIYEIVNEIRQVDYLNEYLETCSPFEKKIINILVDKKIVNYERSSKEDLNIAIGKITAPEKFLEIIQEELNLKGKIEFSESQYEFDISRGDDKQNIQIHITEDSLYVWSSDISIDKNYKQMSNNNFITYAAYVFLEKIIFENRIINNHLIYKVDLRTYTNEVKEIKIDNIDVESFKNSYIADEGISGNTISFDYNSFYPCTELIFFDSNSKKTIRAIGLDENQAIQNLLIIIKGSFNKYIHLENVNKTDSLINGHDLNNKSFFKKIFYLYSNENVEIFTDENNECNYVLDKAVVKIPNKYKSKHFLFLSIYLNKFKVGEISDVYYEYSQDN